MALDPRKRQRKLEKKRAKHKAAQANNRKRMQTLMPDGVRQIVAVASRGAVYEAHVSNRLFDAGIGYVVLSRRMPLGAVACACFLVDAWCLGVKNVLVKRSNEGEYRTLLARLGERQALRPVSSAYACKLVTESVEYARKYGLHPHADYAVARQMLTDIDPSECSETFQFGKDGKPFYVSGPNDSLERSRQIINLIGAGNMDYIVGVESLTEIDELGYDDEENDPSSETLESLEYHDDPELTIEPRLT